MKYNYKMFEDDQIEYIQVGPAEDLSNGERLFLEVDDQVIVVFNIAGEFFAILDECSHDNNSFDEGDLDGYELTCPRHGAVFDVRDGKALSLPAVVDIPAYPTRVVNGQLEIGLPVED